MANNDAHICNMALARIGASTFITTLDDASKEAQVCKIFYAQARDEVLEVAPWPFAMRRKSLSKLDDKERSGWTYAYALPDDCIAPRYIYPGKRPARVNEQIPYTIEENAGVRMLMTDEDEAELLYTARVGNETAWPALFVDALAWKLASHLAMPLAARPDLEQLALQRYRMAEARALNAAYQQLGPDKEPDAEYIAER